MLKRKILEENRSYTFRSYFELPYDTDEVLSEFGYSFRSDNLDLPIAQKLPDRLPALKQEMQEMLRLTLLSTETAKREILIAPLITEVARFCQCQLRIEYSVNVSERLKGELDYLFRSDHSLLVVEAKRDDLTRGFTQLAVELIAMSELDDHDLLYGAVTTGNVWQFGVLDRKQALITQDIQQFLVIDDLERLAATLINLLLKG
jgi:hypothetical protein